MSSVKWNRTIRETAIAAAALLAKRHECVWYVYASARGWEVSEKGPTTRIGYILVRHDGTGEVYDVNPERPGAFIVTKLDVAAAERAALEMGGAP